MMKRRTPVYAALAALSVLSVACSDSPMAARPPVDGPNLAISPVFVDAGALQMFEEKVAVCKVFTGSVLSYPTASFSVVFTGTFNETVNFSLQNGKCADLGMYGGSGVNVTVTETAIPNYSTSWTTQLWTKTVGSPTVAGPVSAPTSGLVATGSAFGTPNPATGTKFVFTNAYIPPPGCTFTQGYWKTHSLAGPAAKYDDTWALLPGGLEHNTVFFTSGKTWLGVFGTPVGGNAYYSLAHQYMAARLNVLNGASTPAAVASAITTATTLFATYTPAQIAALKGSDALRQQFVALAGTLGSYNEGITGPGHCGE